MSLLNAYYSGTSGLVLPVNKTNFPEAYKDKSRLEFYGTIFNSIEINTTFYKLPKIITVEKWAASVPDSFRFTFKIPKLITHAANFKFREEDIIQFIDIVDHVDDKKGCLLAQFPPSFKISHIKILEQVLNHFADCSPNMAWHIAVEFRDESWYCNQTYELLFKYGVILVQHDKIHVEVPQSLNEFPVGYWRFHGSAGNYRGSYSDSFLQQKAMEIKDFLRSGHAAFIYFNNTMGDAIGNLNSLNNHMKS